MIDKVLRGLVQDELDWEPSVDAVDIGVAVENGIVHLSGRVSSYAQKIAAEAAVKRVKGVRGYVEDLEIRPQGAGYSDVAIASRAANVLDWDATVPKDAVKVKVDGGIVTLSGQVDWQYQRTAAENGIRPLAGVRGVINQIRVKPVIQAGDIKRRIEDALERQAELEAGKIHVSVIGDKVRLDGKVRAWFERDIAERAAWSAPGVKQVDDHVSVGP